MSAGAIAIISICAAAGVYVTVFAILSIVLDMRKKKKGGSNGNMKKNGSEKGLMLVNKGDKTKGSDV